MTFHKVLIANRGEIALRVIEACRELSLDSVAVFSQADAGMHYLTLAGESLCIGPADPAKSYLSIPALISVAEATGAQAVHPGYGFLAEDPHFVEVCEEHGLVFIGPDRRVMELLGNKLAAREAVAALGVPVLPGEAVPEDEEKLADTANRVGYPLLVKSVFGGGGRGMRLVKEPAGLKAAVLVASAESQAACGDASLYLERSLENPRHIEVQIMVDKGGRIVHLGERECSIQRRHQKLIEETPALNLDESLRQGLYHAALVAVRGIGYKNVGTVEFILDGRGDFHFIEMNARIQVEHSVSEVICGLNLVKEQIRIASGDPLDMRQEDVELKGHAIECRINAEDPSRGFLPSCGKIKIDELPSGNGIRIDTHIFNGMEVSPYYDSLLAKVIAWGRDREEARIRMYTALERFRVRGVTTTRALVQEIISHPAFREDRIGTDFLDEILAD
ncbi:acetyl-CoA carboxylase biotin carboxylase subunit [Candidatus Bipolaricaulota bacterium]|nr:acetyl-CoA carboxylase biotin carboxylase subunit [Candidatus Bipolaricaulota bacterium]